MSVKIIGKFSEVDGAEFETIGKLIKANGIIGSLSADVGTIELYYDGIGNTYAVAHDSEEYYGKKNTNDAVNIENPVETR